MTSISNHLLHLSLRRYKSIGNFFQCTFKKEVRVGQFPNCFLGIAVPYFASSLWLRNLTAVFPPFSGWLLNKQKLGDLYFTSLSQQKPREKKFHNVLHTHTDFSQSFIRFFLPRRKILDQITRQGGGRKQFAGERNSRHRSVPASQTFLSAVIGEEGFLAGGRGRGLPDASKGRKSKKKKMDWFLSNRLSLLSGQRRAGNSK